MPLLGPLWVLQLRNVTGEVIRFSYNSYEDHAIVVDTA